MNRVGRLATLVCGRRTKWLVLVFWAVVLGASAPLAGNLTSVESNEASSWLPASAESTKVLEIADRFQSMDVLPTLVVYERQGGVTSADSAAVAADARELADLPRVEGDVAGPIPSEDGEALQVVVPVDIGSDGAGWEAMPDVTDRMREVAGEGAEDGLAVHVTGPGGLASDQAEAFGGVDSTLLFAAVAVVVIMLLLTYRSPLLWLLPLLSVGFALTVAQGVIYLCAKYADLTVNAQSASILTVLVFGAGTDYALLLVARYREELRRHEDRHEAMAFALHRAGPALIASAATVAIGMLCLLAAEMNSTKGLGPVASIGIAVALLAMVSLLPALLVIFGRWFFWPLRPTYGSEDHTASGVWARVGTVIARRPRLTWVVTSLVLGAMALGTLGLNANGQTNAQAFTETPDSIVGERVVARHYPAGAGVPVEVVSNASAAGEVRQAFAATDGIAQVGEPVVKGEFAYMQGTLEDPATSPEAKATVERVRDSVHAVPGADAQAGGQTALILDTGNANEHDRNVIIPLVLLVVLVILVALLRALVAPLLLIATVVLSFGAALGISALVFEHVLGVPAADQSFPLFAFVFLVALGIDYNIFLMTRVHEEAKQMGTRRGALVGLAATGGVITSAGLVLAGTFGVLGTLPLTFLVQLGFAVALGVLLDTIIVRAVLVTALNLDVGRWMWWPSALARKRDVDAGELEGAEPAAVR